MNLRLFPPPAMNRRGFLCSASALALSAASYSRVDGANGRLGYALVGCGTRGRYVSSRLLASDRAELRCICDVYDERRKSYREALHLSDPPFETSAIEEALARPDVDAVLIATPDHLHVNLAVLALEAKKHLYLEKPIAHQLAEHSRLVAAAKKNSVVIQTGTQQRSGAHYRRVKEEIIDAGRLGQILFVRGVWHDFPRQRRPFETRSQPSGLDWGRFLGPAPRRPFEWMRYDSWRLFRDYGGGSLADILTHWVDVAQWYMDDPRPLDAVASGGIYGANDGRENPDTVSATLKYAKKWNFDFECSLLPVRGTRPHVAFYGTKGLLEISRTDYLFQPSRGAAVSVKTHEDLEAAHVKSWLDAISGQGTPTAKLASGLSACEAVHLAKAAYWSGKRARFDATATRIIEV